jgi:hypothetical protein
MEPIEVRRKAIALNVERARGSYPGLWRRLIREWSSGDFSDSTWLSYAANYLFDTAGVHWALDPFALSSRIAGVDPPDYLADFECCSVIVLSHAHKDHLDMNLIRAVQSLPVQWVIPRHMLQTVLDRVSIPSRQIIVPEYGEPIRISGLTLTAFEGLHLAEGRGVPSTGYLAEFAGKSWLIPGDTRRYDLASLPVFNGLDGVFAHLWLGRASALMEPPPLLEPFCRFFAGLRTRRIVVTHLHELGRDADDYWDERHFEVVRDRFRELDPRLEVIAAIVGDRVIL